MTRTELQIDEVARLVKQTPATLAKWRVRKRGPAYYKLGRHVVYYLEDVTLWIEAQRHDGDRTAARTVVHPVPARRAEGATANRFGGYQRKQDRSTAVRG